MKEQKQVKNPKGMLLMTVIVIILVLYLEWKVIDSYLKGGEGAASLTLVIISSIVMVAGCVLIACLAIKLYKQSREAAEEIPDAEIAPVEESDGESEETGSEEEPASDADAPAEDSSREEGSDSES